jgi:hypothetical protein
MGARDIRGMYIHTTLATCKTPQSYNCYDRQYRVKTVFSRHLLTTEYCYLQVHGYKVVEARG